MTTHSYENVLNHLKTKPYRWLVTGVAGFIGSHLLHTLLTYDQTVVGLDNFATGSRENLDEIKCCVSPEQWQRFTFIEGDIADYQTCYNATRKLCSSPKSIVLHQAALGSVPRSIEMPLDTNQSNVTGFLNILNAARECRIKRFVYASSSAVYGDSPVLPKREEMMGKPLSPYAVTKYVNELYGDVFTQCYGMEIVGLRYFNVFGPRQAPDGPYAAVIPRWIEALIHHKPVYIHGDGGTSRDFCYVDNVVQANILSALTENKQALNQVYNVALNEAISLQTLFELIRDKLVTHGLPVAKVVPEYGEFRQGDIRHSRADISKIIELLQYQPRYGVDAGLDKTIEWYTLRP